MRLVLVFYDWVPKAPEFGTKPNLFFLNEIFLLGLPSLQEHKPYSQNVDGIPMRGPNRPVVKKGKIMISLSSVILFKEARSGFLHFFNLYDKSQPENQTKRGEIDLFRTISKVLIYVHESFSLRFWFEKNRFPGDPQKHFRNSGRFGPLPATGKGTQACSEPLWGT